MYVLEKKENYTVTLIIIANMNLEAKIVHLHTVTHYIKNVIQCYKDMQSSTMDPLTRHTVCVYSYLYKMQHNVRR